MSASLIRLFCSKDPVTLMQQKTAAAMPCMIGRIGYTLFCAHSTNSSKLMSLHTARIPVCQRPVLTWSLGVQQCTQLDAITCIMQCLHEDDSSPVSILVQKLHSLFYLSSVQVVSFLLPTTTKAHLAEVPQPNILPLIRDKRARYSTALVVYLINRDGNRGCVEQY